MVATDLDKFNMAQLGYTVRGIVAEEDGNVIGTAGVIHTEPPYAFAHVLDPMRKYPKAIMKIVRDFDIFLQSNYDAVYAVADTEENNAPRVLHKIGFRYYGTNPQGDVYRWHKQQYQ